MQDRFIKRTLLFALAICLTFAKAQSTAEVSSEYTYMDLVYKTEGRDTLKLDLFLPDLRFGQQVPLLVIVHGGAWIAGDKELESIYYMRRMKERLLESGIGVASVQYRLVDKQTHFPAPIEDVKDACRWLFAHHQNYRIDTTNVGVWGGSAGGHLAMLMAYSKPEDFPGLPGLRDQNFKLNYVIDNFGPTDLNSLFRVEMGRVGVLFFKTFVNKLYEAREKLSFAMTGLRFQEEFDDLKKANKRYSPLEYIDEDAVPTLILHGTKDRIVPYAQSQNLQAILLQHDVAQELITVIDGDHGFNNISDTRINRLVEQTIDFIFRHTRR